LFGGVESAVVVCPVLTLSPLSVKSIDPISKVKFIGYIALSATIQSS
jgi:hypothetical protein